MNLIKVANETIRICKEAKYEAEGTQVVFPGCRGSDPIPGISPINSERKIT